MRAEEALGQEGGVIMTQKVRALLEKDQEEDMEICGKLLILRKNLTTLMTEQQAVITSCMKVSEITHDSMRLLINRFPVQKNEEYISRNAKNFKTPDTVETERCFLNLITTKKPAYFETLVDTANEPPGLIDAANNAAFAFEQHSGDALKEALHRRELLVNTCDSMINIIDGKQPFKVKCADLNDIYELPQTQLLGIIPREAAKTAWDRVKEVFNYIAKMLSLISKSSDDRSVSPASSWSSMWSSGCNSSRSGSNDDSMRLCSNSSGFSTS